MYQPYPGGTQMPEPSSRPPAPQSVLRAVQAMYAGAAVSLIGIVIGLTTLSSAKSQIESQHPGWTTAQVNSSMHLAVGSLIVSGLIGAALWLWMARTCKAGKGWARIVSSVLFAIETVNVIAGAAVPGGNVTRIYAIVVWLVGAVAIFLLWQRTSSEYFRGTPRY
jgi:hypothetical protein